jgi:hypothetical protein
LKTILFHSLSKLERQPFANFKTSELPSEPELKQDGCRRRRQLELAGGHLGSTLALRAVLMF